MKKHVIADFSLLMVAFVWGATFVLVQNAIAFLPPLTFNAVRFLMASGFLFMLLALFYKKQLKAINKKLVFSGIILGIWLFGGYGFQTIGLQFTTTSKSAFITGLSVVLVPVLGIFILKQLPKLPAVIGVIIATVGLYLLTLGESLDINPGDVWSFFCAVSFAMQITLTGKYAPHFPSLALALIQITTVGVISAMGGFLFEDWQKAFDPQIMGTPEVFWALIITVIPATALAFLVQTQAQKFTTATRVALIYAMEPVFAAIAAFLWTDEVLTAKAILGCLGIFTGMILAEMPPEYLSLKRRKKSENHCVSP
ncbi:MAG: DMT family transporter [Bacillaceae bacterium]|nr:DMT family transporter [Bacillaceae bacterium]